MKTKIMYSTVILLVIAMTVLLLIKDEKDLIILTSDNVISIYHSDDNEKITFELLTNKPQNYYFSNEFLSSANIENSEEVFSLEVSQISVSDVAIPYLEDQFYNVIITCQLEFTSNDYEIKMEDVNLHLNYENSDEIIIRVGEFNYLFSQEFNNDITLNNMSGTYEEIDGVNTIGGINLTLGNVSDNNINITNIEILSNSVSFNSAFALERDECEQTYSVKECLTMNNFDFHSLSTVNEVSFLLRKNNEIALYLPLTYLSETRFIHRFACKITYDINGEERVLILDDFPFMRTSIFNDSVKDDFNVYTIAN